MPSFFAEPHCAVIRRTIHAVIGACKHHFAGFGERKNVDVRRQGIVGKVHLRVAAVRRLIDALRRARHQDGVDAANRGDVRLRRKAVGCRCPRYAVIRGDKHLPVV